MEGAVVARTVGADAGSRPEGLMTEENPLERLSSAQLHDMALHRARRHLDVRFFWNLMQLLPAAEASTGKLDDAETNVLRLSAHVDDVTQAGEGPVADALRPYYVEYLSSHGVKAPS
jgi:hypothetical protein